MAEDDSIQIFEMESSFVFTQVLFHKVIVSYSVPLFERVT